jgi:hypothetical protein
VIFVVNAIKSTAIFFRDIGHSLKTRSKLKLAFPFCEKYDQGNYSKIHNFPVKNKTSYACIIKKIRLTANI